MPLVLKFNLESKTSHTFICTVRGYLNNKKAICVVTQLPRLGDLPLSSNDVSWASAVDQFTNDDSMEFGKVMDYEDIIWVEDCSSSNSSDDNFEQVEFDIIQPDKKASFIQKLANPTRKTLSTNELEKIIGEKWNIKAEPEHDAFEYWYKS